MYRFKKVLPNKCIESLYVLQCFDKYEKTRIAGEAGVQNTKNSVCNLWKTPTVLNKYTEKHMLMLIIKHLILCKPLEH